MADEIVEGAHPTRMELLQVKNKLRLARKGHRLLREKRDTLLMEFMNLAKTAGETADEAADQLTKSRHAFAVSSALSGSGQLLSAAMAAPKDLDAGVEFRNVMGIQLPTMSLEARLRQIDERGFSIMNTHPSIDAAAAEYERSVASLMGLAQAETSLVALSQEVKKTKRRVNALEYKVIPRLDNTQKYIRMRLEEFEREGFYRRKMIKRKRGLE